ncbi:Ribonuclease P protein subunit p40 [Echinococcus multilocularis]|uniref:Ribonuclease P protein subunit p40 n=1 Tax=Echinococcus multilocularis TaxID=6211 RepID=A0A0S4MIF9_ECHMU|nr:Ribonuclease P protein subunit p40 [Echinococcus multilocularis]
MALWQSVNSQAWEIEDNGISVWYRVASLPKPRIRAFDKLLPFRRKYAICDQFNCLPMNHSLVSTAKIWLVEMYHNFSSSRVPGSG